jgi:hypothetical protein
VEDEGFRHTPSAEQQWAMGQRSSTLVNRKNLGLEHGFSGNPCFPLVGPYLKSPVASTSSERGLTHAPLFVKAFIFRCLMPFLLGNRKPFHFFSRKSYYYLRLSPRMSLPCHLCEVPWQISLSIAHPKIQPFIVNLINLTFPIAKNLG